MAFLINFQIKTNKFVLRFYNKNNYNEHNIPFYIIYNFVYFGFVINLCDILFRFNNSWHLYLCNLDSAHGEKI